MIEFNIPLFQVFTLLSAVVFPLLVGLVTKRATNPGRKAVLLAALSVLISLCTELAGALEAGTAYNLGTALLTGLGAFLVAVAMHYGLWKPTGVAEKLQAVGDASGTSGVTDTRVEVPVVVQIDTDAVVDKINENPGKYLTSDPTERGKPGAVWIGEDDTPGKHVAE